MHDFLESLINPSSPMGRLHLDHLEDADFWKQVEMSLLWLLKSGDTNLCRGEDRHLPVQQNVSTCIQILDRLASIMPRDAGSVVSLLNGPVFWGNLETKLLNKILSQWKRELLAIQSENRRIVRAGLPLPSEMAEKVDGYRWKCMVQPNATSFNILIHSMVKIDGVAAAEKYLERLIQVALQGLDEDGPAMVDTVTVSTIIQGWADAGQPEKAQNWLEQMIASCDNDNSNACSLLGIRPNTMSFTFAINGWAKQAKAEKAEELLKKHLEIFGKYRNEQLAPDRVLFHTVLDAWSKVRDPKLRIKIAPQRAEQLMELMNKVAEREKHDHESVVSDPDALRPNMETWCKLVAIYARTNAKGYGPTAAANILYSVEQEMGETAPIVTVNRILYGYTNLRKMKEAQMFLESRLEQTLDAPSLCKPDRFTLNTLLAGFSELSKSDPEAPIHAQNWFDRLSTEHAITPIMETYGSLLNVWCGCVRLRDDAAEKTEQILRNQVLDLYHAKPISHSEHNPKWLSKRRASNFKTENDFTICLNIVLKAWAIHASHHRQNSEESQHAVERSLRLLHELLQVDDEDEDKTQFAYEMDGNLRGVRAKPTEATFRAVLHGILDSSISQKYERANVILDLMQRCGFEANFQDLERLARMTSQSRASRSGRR